MAKPAQIISWILQVAIAGIFVAFAISKLRYVPMTQAIFGEIGGRPAATTVAVMELVAAALLLIPRTIPYGAILAVFVLLGAITTHMAKIGISLTDPETGKSDGGSMFMMAIGFLIASLVVFVLRKSQFVRSKTSEPERAP
ncbi:MAG TPA: hypothetical protein ENJ00_02555 [Phycisphaerales bacterium]|nr:hypothetical protein [Phycisphaerales bacterium]